MATKRSVKTKRRKRRLRQSTAPSVVQPQQIDLGHVVDVSVKGFSADFIEMTLLDGTKLELTPVVFGIKRSTEKFNPLGDPIYQLNIGFTITPKVPKKLKLKQS